jgi:hypothetical protein
VRLGLDVVLVLADAPNHAAAGYLALDGLFGAQVPLRGDAGPRSSVPLLGCRNPLTGAYLGGRPRGGRMGAMAASRVRRGPDQSAGTASTALATAYAACS